MNTFDWQAAYEIIKQLPYDLRVHYVQELVQTKGPIPNEFGDRFRALLKP